MENEVSWYDVINKIFQKVVDNYVWTCRPRKLGEAIQQAGEEVRNKAKYTIYPVTISNDLHYVSRET